MPSRPGKAFDTKPVHVCAPTSRRLARQAGRPARSIRLPQAVRGHFPSSPWRMSRHSATWCATCGWTRFTASRRIDGGMRRWSGRCASRDGTVAIILAFQPPSPPRDCLSRIGRNAITPTRVGTRVITMGASIGAGLATHAWSATSPTSRTSRSGNASGRNRRNGPFEYDFSHDSKWRAISLTRGASSRAIAANSYLTSPGVWTTRPERALRRLPRLWSEHAKFCWLRSPRLAYPSRQSKAYCQSLMQAGNMSPRRDRQPARPELVRSKPNARPALSLLLASVRAAPARCADRLTQHRPPTAPVLTRTLTTTNRQAGALRQQCLIWAVARRVLATG